MLFTYKHKGRAYVRFWYKTVVSSLVFQSVVLLLFAALSWYIRTIGIFHAALNVNASALGTARTEKSLKRCH